MLLLGKLFRNLQRFCFLSQLSIPLEVYKDDNIRMIDEARIGLEN